MILEYRCYHASPGAMGELHAHMRDNTLPVFEQVGVNPIGFWTASVGALNRLHYVVPYADFDDRSARWGAWLNHPERVFGLRPDGTPLTERIVSEIWEPTDYAGDLTEAVDRLRDAGSPQLYEFHRCEIRRDIPRYHIAWHEALALMHRHDIHPLGFWMTLVGNAPTLNYILTFRDETDRHAKMGAYFGDPDKRLGVADDGGPFTHVDLVETWVTTPYSLVP